MVVPNQNLELAILLIYIYTVEKRIKHLVFAILTNYLQKSKIVTISYLIL